ncbi:hypothetical protein ACRPLV_07640 [Streptococcus uberis]|uniref:hypothetical protein n=1 Tax=Streptococcus uberis TaxID=1349 RepID=UPI003D775C94
MEIKQKHRKHALRKAVTAAVLAGTALSSLGGFAGAVTTVKADGVRRLPKINENFSKELIKIIGERNVNNRHGIRNNDKTTIEKIKELLRNTDKETLFRLSDGFNPSDRNYPDSMLHYFDTKISSLDNGNGKPTSFRSLVVKE